MRIAVCAGTVDPITEGHVDIIRRAADLFDELVVAVAVTNYKATMFSTEERCRLACEALAGLPRVRVEAFDGLLVDFCRRVGAGSIVRGLRAVSDFDKEFQMALMNRELDGGLDTVFLMSDARFLFVSSSIIRNTALAGGDVSTLVPPCVCAALREKVAQRSK